MNYPLLRTVHSWLGVLLSIFVLVMAVSGIFALFFDELQTWENPNLARIDLARQMPLHAVVGSLAAEYELDPDRGLHLRLASATRPTLGLEIPVIGREEKIRLELDPVSLRPLAASGGPTAFFRDLHVSLSLPAPGGNYLVGALGGLMLILIVTGTLLHQNVLRSLITFRVRGGPRTLASDTHKILGLWGLAFHLMITFSGATIGLSHLLEAAVGGALERIAVVDEARLAQSAPTAPLAAAHPMADLDDTLRGACAEFTGTAPHYLIVRGWGLGSARVEARCRLPRELSRHASFRFDATSGERLDGFVMHRDGETFGRIFEAIVFLHVGDFLNIWLRLAYFILAVAIAALAVSGTLIWIVMRAGPDPRFDPGSRLLIGLQLGFLLAAAALILHHRLDSYWFGAFSGSGSVAQSWLFIGAWAATVLYCCSGKSLIGSARRILIATAILVLLGVVANIPSTWQAISDVATPAARAIVVPDLLLVMFAGLILLGRRILRTG